MNYDCFDIPHTGESKPCKECGKDFYRTTEKNRAWKGREFCNRTCCNRFNNKLVLKRKAERHKYIEEFALLKNPIDKWLYGYKAA